MGVQVARGTRVLVGVVEVMVLAAIVFVGVATWRVGGRILVERASIAASDVGLTAFETRSMDLQAVVDSSDLVEETITPGTSQRTLFVVTSDRLLDIQQVAGEWTSLLKAFSGGGARSDLEIATVDGVAGVEGLLAEARSEGITHRVYRIRDARSFSAGTGILIVPFTVVLDSNRRLRKAVTGAVSREAGLWLGTPDVGSRVEFRFGGLGQSLVKSVAATSSVLPGLSVR